MSFLDLDDFFNRVEDKVKDKVDDFDDLLPTDDDLLSPVIRPTTTRPLGPGLIPNTPTEFITSQTSTVSSLPPTTTTSLPSFTLETTSTSSVPSTTRSVVSSVPTPTYYSTLEPEIVTNIVTATISKPTPSPSQNSASTNSKSTESSGPSPVAIGVTVTIAVLSAIAAIVFFVRRRYINRRKNRRQTWNAPVAPGKDEEAGHKRQDEDHFDDIDINEKQSAVPLPDNFTLQNTAGYGAYAAYPGYPQPGGVAVGQTFPPASLPAPPPPLHPTGFAPVRAPSPPPIVTGRAQNSGSPAPLGLDMSTPVFQTTNNVMPIGPFSAVTSPHPSMTVPSLTAVRPGTPALGAILTVTRTFTPSLADELSVQIGEQVRVIENFDDGWARCERLKGGMGAEAGFVPVECLSPVSSTESVPGMGMMQEKVDNWRLSHRQSSLNPAAGRY